MTAEEFKVWKTLKFVCGICRQAYERYDDLAWHIRTVHGKEPEGNFYASYEAQ